MHLGAIGVEDACHLDPNLVLAMVIEKEGFRTSLSFVVTGARPDAVHIPPIALWLGMNGWVSVHFGSGCLKDFGLETFRQPQHVDRAVDIDFGRLNRIVLIMNGRGRTGQVIDFVHLDVEGKGDVVSEKFKIGVIEEMDDIPFGSRIEIVHTEDILSFF